MADKLLQDQKKVKTTYVTYQWLRVKPRKFVFSECLGETKH